MKELCAMDEKNLPIDLTKHKVYSRNAKKCVQKLLMRYYDEKTAAELWEKVRDGNAGQPSTILKCLFSNRDHTVGDG